MTLASDDNSGKFVTVVLEKGDELKILNRLESSSAQGGVSKVYIVAQDSLILASAFTFIERVIGIQTDSVTVKILVFLGVVLGA